MRFVLAIISLVLAAAMIVLGIAQRTVFLGPAFSQLETTVETTEPYTVINGSVLTSQPGKQSVTVSGAEGETVFVGYGRTADVDAWLGTSSYNQVTLNREGDALASQVKAPTPGGTVTELTRPETVSEESWVNPAGSDMWLGESSEEGAVVSNINVDESISVLIASNGSAPAPQKIQMSWPIDNSTPWAGPLIVGGLLLLLAGIVLYLLGIRQMRKSRGPRRKGITPLPEDESGVKLPKARKYRPEGKRWGRSLRVAALPLALTGALALAGCSPAYWPGGGTAGDAPTGTGIPTVTSTPTGTEEPLDERAPSVVTEAQAERIVAKISVTTHTADSERSLDLLRTRFAGPALAEREANYKIRETVADYQQATSIPGSPVRVTLPQATEGWPRTVFTIVHDEEDPTAAPTAMMLVQENPRLNYVAHYATKLEPKVVMPDMAPTQIGAALVPADSSFLRMAPDQLAAAYGSVLDRGEESEFAGLFEAEGDSLRTQTATFREGVTASLADKAAEAAFETQAGAGQPRALATNESGAVVAVSMLDLVKISPTDADAVVKMSGAGVAALLGAGESTKPVLTTYEDQLLFYVPAKDSDEKIKLLGFSQGLIKAEEVQ